MMNLFWQPAVSARGLKVKISVFRQNSGKECLAISLLEVSFATMILAMVMLSLLSTLYSVQMINIISAKYRLADTAACEQLQQARYVILTLMAQGKVAEIYDSQTGYGTAEAPATFSVPGLKPLRPKEPVGTIFVIQNENSVWLGEPLDLNLDGRLDSETWKPNYKIFPVRVKISWQSKTGKQLTHTASTVIAPKDL